MRQPKAAPPSAFCSLLHHFPFIPSSSPLTRGRSLLSQSFSIIKNMASNMLPRHSFFIVIALVQISVSSARAQTIETVGWQSDPNGRGTFTLASSCIFTLIICVYSAMHLNVPPRQESTVQSWLRNIKWGLLGIFGPELVVFIAWKQYLSAKSIGRRAQLDPRGNSERRNHDWRNVKKDTDLVT